MEFVKFLNSFEHYQIWFVILVMISLAIALLFILIIIRFFTDRAKAVKKIRKDYLKKIIVTYLESPLQESANLFKFNERDGNIVAEIAMEIFNLFVGDEKEKLLKFLQDLKIDQLMIKNLNHRKPIRKILAIELLFYFASEEIVEKIRSKLLDKSFSVRHAAVVALAGIDGAKYFPLIYQQIIKEEQLSYPLIREIFYKCGAKISDQLAEILTDKNTRNRVRAAALKILGDFGNPKSLNSIMAYCEHENDHLRALAFESLAKLNVKISDKIILEGLKDRAWQVRFNALRILANSGFSDFTILEELLQDKNWMVRNRVLQIIIDSDGGKKFLAILANQNSPAGKVAYQYLNEKGILRNV